MTEVPVPVLVGRPGDLLPGDLLIDSSWEMTRVPEGVVRVDHHTDHGWTQLDSVAANEEVVRKPYRRVATNYLDPDAVLGAAVVLGISARASSGCVNSVNTISRSSSAV